MRHIFACRHNIDFFSYLCYDKFSFHKLYDMAVSVYVCFCIISYRKVSLKWLYCWASIRTWKLQGFTPRIWISRSYKQVFPWPCYIGSSLGGILSNSWPGMVDAKYVWHIYKEGMCIFVISYLERAVNSNL